MKEKNTNYKNMTDLNKIKSILEHLCQQNNFSGNKMFQQIDPILISEFPSTTTKLKQILQQNYQYVITSLLRNVFLIELVNNDISSTKMEVRWVQKKSEGKKQESFNKSDPRFCPFSECKIIFLELIKNLIKHLKKPENLELLDLYVKYNLIPYELPIDYVAVNKSKRLHTKRNLDWLWTKHYHETIKLREFLLSKTGNNSRLFSKILKDKLKVKTYLTDRVQTGAHKTNREKRWEAHPDSVHFSLRKDCLLIEKKLISQICFFENFPKKIHAKIQNLISNENFPYRCPITLEKMNFKKFKVEVQNPNHGLSTFHVGHLNPLKSERGSKNGHIFSNIGWISDNGNRIQGSLSLKNTRKLLSKIQANYSKHLKNSKN